MKGERKREKETVKPVSLRHDAADAGAGDGAGQYGRN